jgi:hypothetical protein
MSRRKIQDSAGDKEEKVNIKCAVVGEPARIFFELKRRGIVRSARDAFVQGIISLHEKVVARDLQLAQLKASQRLEEL